MVNQSELSSPAPALGKTAKLKNASLRPEVQILTFIVVLIFVGLLVRLWQPMAWLFSALLIGLYLAGVVGFLMLAALTPTPYSFQPRILLVRLRQLAKGIWAALMLVLSALLGAAISADLLRYGTHDFSGFLVEVFVPGYLSAVVSIALWGGMYISMLLATTDPLIARELARADARLQGMRFLADGLGLDREAEQPYGLQLLGSVWRNLTGGSLRLVLIGYLITPVVATFTYVVIDQLVS